MSDEFAKIISHKQNQSTDWYGMFYSRLVILNSILSGQYYETRCQQLISQKTVSSLLLFLFVSSIHKLTQLSCPLLCCTKSCINISKYVHNKLTSVQCTADNLLRITDNSCRLSSGHVFKVISILQKVRGKSSDHFINYVSLTLDVQGKTHLVYQPICVSVV